MFTFKSPANPKHIWTLCFRDQDMMQRIFYEHRTPEEGVKIHGITEYETSTIYIDKGLDGFPLAKALRHELTHIYLWETGQQAREYTEEELCDIMSTGGVAIIKSVAEILLRLKEGFYKNGKED